MSVFLKKLYFFAYFVSQKHKIPSISESDLNSTQWKLASVLHEGKFVEERYWVIFKDTPMTNHINREH